MNWFNKILGTRIAGIICLLFAIANRVVFASLYSLIGADTKLQLVFAKNFLAGKGMGVTKYFTTDLNTPVFDTYQVFPPGFSFVIIPILKIFDGDEQKAVLAYDIIVAVLFVFAVRYTGKKAGLTPAYNNIVTLIAGCFQYIFFMAWSATDAICVCLTLLALAKTVEIVNRKEAIPFFTIIALGLLFSASFFFRYMYLPIAVLFPFLILFFGFYLNNKNLKTSGWKLLAASVSFLLLLFALSLSIAGNALHVTGVERGLFPEQFADCYPFLPASFINIDFGAQLMQNFLGSDYSRVIFYLKIINPVILIFLLFLLWKFITARKKELQISRHSLFIIIGSSVCLTIILLLAYLTLTYKELSWGYHKWTFVGENRYFAVIYVLIPVLFFVVLNHNPVLFKQAIMRGVVFAGLCCLATEVIHGVYYNTRILLVHKDLAYIRESDKAIKQFPFIVSAIKKQYPGREVLVCSKDQLYLHTASESGCKSIFDYDNFLEGKLKVTSKSILIMPVNTADVIIINAFIEKNNLRLINTISGISFYTQQLDPY